MRACTKIAYGLALLLLGAAQAQTVRWVGGWPAQGPVGTTVGVMLAVVPPTSPDRMTVYPIGFTGPSGTTIDAGNFQVNYDPADGPAARIFVTGDVPDNITDGPFGIGITFDGAPQPLIVTSSVPFQVSATTPPKSPVTARWVGVQPSQARRGEAVSVTVDLNPPVPRPSLLGAVLNFATTALSSYATTSQITSTEFDAVGDPVTRLTVHAFVPGDALTGFLGVSILAASAAPLPVVGSPVPYAIVDAPVTVTDLEPLHGPPGTPITVTGRITTPVTNGYPLEARIYFLGAGGSFIQAGPPVPLTRDALNSPIVAHGTVPAGAASAPVLLLISMTNNNLVNFSPEVFTVDAGPGTIGGAGDLNGDGKITVADAVIILRIVVGLQSATAQQLQAGDLNGDGKITVADAIRVLRIVVHLDPPPSVPVSPPAGGGCAGCKK